MVSLLGAVAGTDGDLSVRKRQLMDGLSALLGADCWVWEFMAPREDGEQLSSVGFLQGGFSEERLGAYRKVVAHPIREGLTRSFLAEASVAQGHLTRLGQNLDSTSLLANRSLHALRQMADIGPLLFSVHPLPDRCMSFVSLYRKADDTLFTEREARMAQVLLSNLPWFHEHFWPQESITPGVKLPPRLRAILNLLLKGHSRKHIAAHLEISLNTVSGYVKEVYRVYQVHSHAELITRFRDGSELVNPIWSRSPSSSIVAGPGERRLLSL